MQVAIPWNMKRRCLTCNRPLGLFARIRYGRFCSSLHQRAEAEYINVLASRRLNESATAQNGAAGNSERSEHAATA
jgi:hypothetical protein